MAKHRLVPVLTKHVLVPVLNHMFDAMLHLYLVYPIIFGIFSTRQAATFASYAPPKKCCNTCFLTN